MSNLLVVNASTFEAFVFSRNKMLCGVARCWSELWISRRSCVQRRLTGLRVAGKGEHGAAAGWDGSDSPRPRGRRAGAALCSLQRGSAVPLFVSEALQNTAFAVSDVRQGAWGWSPVLPRFPV